MTTGSFVYAATRTPFGRFGGALAEVRPDDLGATVVTGLLDTVPALDPAVDRRRGLGQRERRGGGQPQRRPDGRPARGPAGLGTGDHREPAVRVLARRRDHGISDRGVRRRRPRARGRLRVDDPGAVGAPEAVPRLSRRRRHSGLDHPWLAAGQFADAGRMDRIPRRGERAAPGAVRHLPRAAGRVRAELAPPGRRGLDRGLLRQPGDPGPGRGSEAGRRRTRRRVSGQVGGAQARVPAHRHHHRRERVAAQRRGVGGADRIGEGGRARRPRTRWPGSPAEGSRP